MTGWYADYFTADYWSFARHEYTAERTAGEVAYLAGILRKHAPGRRVLDLGCGIGRHAVPLARHGFEVVGVDVCAWALDRAAEAAGRAGVRVGLLHADLLAAPDLPEADAAICVQSFGWGSDAEQRALLARVRERLAAGGVLILDHSNVSAILSRYEPAARFEAEGEVFDFLRSYDPVSGRSRGELRVTRRAGSGGSVPESESESRLGPESESESGSGSGPDSGSGSGETVAVLRDDVRLYQPSEVTALLRETGYDVVRADADFTAGSPVRPGTRYVQFVAVAPARPELAVLDHARSEPSAGQVDLRWAPDEVEYVREAVDRAWARVAAEPGGLAETARRYALDDPYGGVRAAPVLGRHFGADLPADRVVTGAGTTGLLNALSALVAPGTPLLCTPYAHPDLPAWAARRGAALHVFDPADGEAPELVARLRPSMVLVERPGVRGDLLPPGRVLELAEAVSEAGGLLVVDEACAAYAGPEVSAVPLTTRTRGLVVLRSVSKGYCCGGLRAGFAVASAGAAGALRAVAPPLAVSPLSLEVALRLLEQGDVLGPLRAAVAEAKPELVAALRYLGREADPGHPALPWVTVEGDAPPGVLGRPLRHRAGGPALTRISVPLSAVRRRALREAVAAAGGGERTGRTAVGG
ncbi:aminotransferase class I/II-fold pyridoxal phosphate-dependent enzyme [Streptosporangium sp. NPDC048047]|uniref:aminotransferase class I/II-fold pyridoxal phosphate-dependent enzyme n=1 Tax=Streptosporangium sp. NPDC048047 TaxID=3155748 RepID=UPI0034377ED3